MMMLEDKSDRTERVDNALKRARALSDELHTTVSELITLLKGEEELCEGSKNDSGE